MNNNLNEKIISKELMLRDGKTGRWIKRSEEELSLSHNSIPSTFIQVVNNQIHYADTDLIISEMLKNRNNEKVEFLEVKYNNVLDNLENTRVYSAGYDSVFAECRSSANEFDNEIRRMADALKSENLYTYDMSVFMSVTNAYIKILFSYLYSAVVLHKEKVKNEIVIYGKIKNLKSYVLDIFELALLKTNRWGDLEYESSIYQAYLYDEKLDIKHLEVLIKRDRRFKSPLDYIKAANTAMVKTNGKSYHCTTEFSGKFYHIDSSSHINVVIGNLIGLLEDIDRLEKIRDEIGGIDDVGILEEFVMQVNK